MHLGVFADFGTPAISFHKPFQGVVEMQGTVPVGHTASKANIVGKPLVVAKPAI